MKTIHSNAFLLACFVCLDVEADALKSINLSDSGTSIIAEFNCFVQYDDHSPRVQGLEVRVKLRAGADCELLLPQGNQAQQVPPNLAGRVNRLTLDNNSPNTSFLVIEFAEPMLFTARPGPADNSIEILTRTLTNKAPDPVVAARAKGAKPKVPNAKMTGDITDLLSTGRNHLLQENYSAGIKIYQQLLALPDGGQHPEALEYLGLAHQLQERTNGPSRQAQAGYEAYLQRFPDNPGASRVQQRLDAMLATSASPNNLPAQQPSTASASGPGSWQFFGSVTQDFWSATYDRDFAPDSINRSALLTLANIQVDRPGERFDLRARLNAGYQNDFSDTDRPIDDQGLVANAFVEITDQQWDWSARVGRQTLYSDGVLGRFDGLRASYRWRPRVRLNLTTGIPVDSPRFTGDTRRQFVAASVDFERLLPTKFDNLSANLFLNRQTIDGIADREAIGAEVTLREGNWQASFLLDYDTSYAVLNSAVLHVGRQFSERLRLYGRVRAFAAPYLTSRNALMGQSVATIDELLESYSNEQIRTLARNRTADGVGTSLGFTTAINQRWNLNGDISYLDIDGAISSGGVAAQPTLEQIYTSMTFVGSSVIRSGDTAIVGFRFDSTNVADTTTLVVDLRIPIGPSLRIGPKLALSWRDASPVGDQQLLVEPGLRLQYRWRNRYRLEFDAGYRLTEMQFNDERLASQLYPEDSELSSELYYSLGWRVDF